MDCTNRLLLGLDLGTSTLKGVIVDTDLSIVAKNKIPAPLYSPQEAYFEMDGNRYYQVVCHLIRSLIEQLPSNGWTIIAMASASASGSTLLTNEHGQAISPIISWLDNRMKSKLHQYLPNLDYEAVYEITGWPYMDKFPLAHLAWLRNHMPEQYKQATVVCMNTEFINYQLSGKWGTDPSTATPFYLLNQYNQQYHPTYLDMLDLSIDKLPPIRPTNTILGTITKQAAAHTGLSLNTQVVLGSYDHPASAKGAGVLKPGQALFSCGTSWACLYPVYDRKAAIAAGFLVDPFLYPTGPWGGVLPLGGFGQIIDERISTYISSAADKYEQFELLAAKADKLPERLRFDLTDPIECRNRWEGLHKSEIARSIMEASCWVMKKRMEQAEEFGITANEYYLAGGPSNIRLWSQIMANIMQAPVKCPHDVYTGAVGAALMAGIGVGVFADETSYWESNKKQFHEFIPN